MGLERLQIGDLGARSETFNAITMKNEVEVLIDGHETFKRYYEVCIAYSSTPTHFLPLDNDASPTLDSDISVGYLFRCWFSFSRTSRETSARHLRWRK